MTTVPETRICTKNDAETNPDGEFVLYWMIANRRTERNFSLQRAVDWARDLKKPLVIFEALRAGYPWASERIHYFVTQGMSDNARRLSRRAALYYPYLEPKPGAGKGLLAQLSRRACVVISDDFPCFFLPRMLRSAVEQIPVRFELVDSNGLLPMRVADKVFSRAVDFRRFLQKTLRLHLDELPDADPLAGVRLPKLAELPNAVNMCWQRDDYDQFESLPDWARKTLAAHERDPRDHVYGLEEFEAAETHDELWNAAQRQLLREGRIHNYLRMLWGKKILHWTVNPRDALDIMIELNNKYALDGRNPNSYSGIFWFLGRYDRAWGPERPIFGKVRYMSSANTARKMRVKGYLDEYGRT